MRIGALLLSLVAMPTWAMSEVVNVLPNGAHVRVAVPDGWTAGDTLLLYQHGLDMDADTNPDLGPLRDLQLAQGYAIAASGYAQSGWALFTAAQDNRDLLAYVTEHYGAPGALITMGGSMGGLIALKLAELPGFESTQGVYALCPPAAGARTWDTAFDLRLAYDAVCEGVGGGELLDGDAPLAWATNLADIPESMGDLSGSRTVQQTYARVHQCTGVALPNWLRTPPQRDRLARLMRFGAFSNEDFFLYNLAYSVFALGDLVRAPDKLAARNPFSSRDVDYDDELINLRVPRIDADPLAAFDLARASSLNGRIAANTRIVSLHTDGDELVRLAHQQVLRSTYGNKVLSVPIDENPGTHCGFSSAELVAGWEQLRGWITSPQSATDVGALIPGCTAAIAQGWPGPCRFAPALPIGALATTMRDRNAAAADYADAAAARISGSWFDPERSGEGVLIERFNDYQASVLWFTYAPVDAPAGLVWLGGVGEIDANGIHVAELRRMYGARFGEAFRSSDVIAAPWGSIDLAFDGADVANHAARLHLRYRGPAEFGSGQRRMQRALSVGPDGSSHRPDRPRDWQYSGTWFDPSRSGEGWLIQQSGAPFERLTSTVWFTYDLDGSALWLSGHAVEQNGHIEILLYRTAGTHFGGAFDAAAVTTAPFGRAVFNFDGCDHAQLQFIPADLRYGEFTRDLVRLTRPDAAAAACAPR
ncbi:MAG: hypothetical protein IPF83_04280 [Rhodanobacteraceae bacterium]|nr:hypothetical protein [Rhodanobacteraceae bacterium]